MITIDGRIGSAELIKYFSNAMLGSLEYGDLSFVGNGPEGLVNIGIERKTLKDLLNSMQSGRLAGHQLIGLINCYHVVYLIVEGMWRTGPKSGILEELRHGGWRPVQLGHRHWMGREIDAFLNTLEVIGHVIVRTTSGPRQTAVLVTNIHKWWQKEWEEHKSHLAMHKSRFRKDEDLSLVKPSLLRRVSAELGGVGWGRSKAIEKYFTSVREMVSASEDQWLAIDGIGKKLAKSIQEELEGSKDSYSNM